jgi:RNA-directed DNA polymerase
MGRVIEPRKQPKSGEPTQSANAEGQAFRAEGSECELQHPNNTGLDDAVPTGSESSARLHMPDARESGELAGASPQVVGGRQPREGDEPQSVGHASEKSRASIVPKKPANSVVTPEESVEGRVAADGKLGERNTHWTQDQVSVHTYLERVGERARQKNGEKFDNLLSHIKVPLLREAYARLNKKAASGVDEVTWLQYGEELDARLADLQDRVHRGSYHPHPVRRVYIPKADGRMRPLGIPALEDRLLQQAVRMILEPIYEAEFLGFSYGFRPKRSQHKALDALYVALGGKSNWVLDADIRSFYDTIDHGWLVKFIEHRIGDKRLVRLLQKWLNAGVMEDGQLHEVTSGTPQGGVISPLLANVYLHYVLDLWVQQWRKRHARGEVYIVRFADDFVMGFQYEQDARSMHTALAERLGKFGLELHSDKTRMLRFGRFARRDSVLDNRERPETFVFLGLTHICAQGPDGRFRVVRRTSRKKRQAKQASLAEEIDRRKHHRVVEQHGWLSSVIRGHCNYYGVPGNFLALRSFRDWVRRTWHRALQRRSQRGGWTLAKHNAFDARFPLPQARITHAHPLARFALP